MKSMLLGLLRERSFYNVCQNIFKDVRENTAINGLFHYPVCVFFGFYLCMKATLEDLASVICIKVDKSTSFVKIEDDGP